MQRWVTVIVSSLIICLDLKFADHPKFALNEAPPIKIKCTLHKSRYVTFCKNQNQFFYNFILKFTLKLYIEPSSDSHYLIRIILSFIFIVSILYFFLQNVSKNKCPIFNVSKSCYVLLTSYDVNHFGSMRALRVMLDRNEVMLKRKHIQYCASKLLNE